LAEPTSRIVGPARGDVVMLVRELGEAEIAQRGVERQLGHRQVGRAHLEIDGLDAVLPPGKSTHRGLTQG